MNLSSAFIGLCLRTSSCTNQWHHNQLLCNYRQNRKKITREEGWWQREVKQ